MKTPDKQIIEAYKKLDNPNYASVGLEVGLNRQQVERRVLKMRAQGLEFPSPKRGRPRKLTMEKPNDTRKHI